MILGWRQQLTPAPRHLIHGPGERGGAQHLDVHGVVPGDLRFWRAVDYPITRSTNYMSHLPESHQ